MGPVPDRTTQRHSHSQISTPGQHQAQGERDHRLQIRPVTQVYEPVR